MDLHVSLEGPGDRATRIYATVRDAVLDGRLAPGDRVPASRELASSLGVARGTVTVAYDRLLAEGFLEARPGAGTFVTAVDLQPERRRQAHPGAVERRRGGHAQPLCGVRSTKRGRRAPG